MKAVVCNRYGPPAVLSVKEIQTPSPGEKEILIRIHSTSVTSAHCLMRKGEPKFGRIFLGLTKPRNPIPGTDFAGEVIEIGSAVKKFIIGEKVFGASDLKGSSYAEYICLTESDVILKKPNNMTYSESASIIEGALTALPFLRETGKISRGQNVLIIGASGSIGTAAVQLAKHFGTVVTGVCSGTNVKMVRSLGADNVIDYTREDFTKNEIEYDLIFDTVGKSSINDCADSLKKDGIYMTPVLNFAVMFQILLMNPFRKKKVKFSATGLRKAGEKLRDLAFIKQLIESGKLKTVIDRHYTLEQVVEAHEYVDTGHKKGNVVIDLINVTDK